jgi:hypothetical protein
MDCILDKKNGVKPNKKINRIFIIILVIAIFTIIYAFSIYRSLDRGYGF